MFINIFINILSMSLAASFCFGMILLMRKILDKKVEIKNQSLLWIVFIITLIIPINFSSKLSIKNYIKFPDVENLNSVIERENEEITISNLELTNLKQSNSTNISKELIFITTYSIYFIVTIVLLFKDLKVYNNIKKIKQSNNGERLEKILQIQMEKQNIKRNIGILIQDKIKSPSLYGIFDTKILILPEVKQLSDDEIEMIILHELIHYQKRHHIIYLALKILEDIHWFNPIIKIAGKFIREDMEYIVDKEILNKNYDRVKYSKTILKTVNFEQFNRLDLLPGIYGNKTSLERRIKSMKNEQGNTKYSVILIVLSIVIISTFTVVFASEKINKTFDDIKEENLLMETTEFSYPLKEYVIANRFGERVHPITGEKKMHNGIDLKAAQGTEIYAIKDGTVVFTNYEKERGNTIRIKHEDGTSSTYAQGLEFLVEPGEQVKAGQAIMTVGSTGMATGPHLHFEMEDQNGNLIDVNKMFE